MAEFIDRQKAIEQIKAEWAKLPLAETTGFGILMRVLASIPAADVRPVVRGKWKLSDDLCWHTCSECGADIDVSVGLLCYVDNEEVCTHNFCPNCGATMEES